MTASILKQDPNTYMVENNSVCYDKTQHANIHFQATKQYLNNS